MSGQLAMSVDDAAEALGVSKDAIYKAVRRNEIPSVKVGARVLIPRRWLEQLFNESSAAVADALATPTGSASASGSVDSTTAEPSLPSAHADDRVVHLPGESPTHSKTGT